jgi:hypothetical protein
MWLTFILWFERFGNHFADFARAADEHYRYALVCHA